jgi:hypothetical protein
MEKCYAKNGRHLSKTEQWMVKLLVLKLRYSQLGWMKILIRFALRMILPNSRPGSLIYYYGNKNVPYVFS